MISRFIESSAVESNFRVQTQTAMLSRDTFTHAVRYHRERLCGTSPWEFVTRTIPRNLLQTAAVSVVRPQQLFHGGTRPVSKSLLANDNLGLKGHKLNRAALISTRNSPDCNSRNIRMRARVWERAKEPHHFEGSFSSLPASLCTLPAGLRVRSF